MAGVLDTGRQAALDCRQNFGIVEPDGFGDLHKRRCDNGTIQEPMRDVPAALVCTDVQGAVSLTYWRFLKSFKFAPKRRLGVRIQSGVISRRVLANRSWCAFSECKLLPDQR
jgi:hypothetical protein